MSSLMNKLTGHQNKDHTVDQHEHGKTYGTPSTNPQQTTTTTTQTTTNNNTLPINKASTNQSINQSAYNQQPTLGGMVHNNTTSAVGTVPYGNNTATSTQRTGAAYTDANIANRDLNNQSNIDRRDDAITRSEEQLRLAKDTVESGTAQLNKYVSVERVEKHIPITRERLVIECFPINQTNIGTFSSNASIGEQHFETILYEDRLAAFKETVPLERIRLAKEVESRVENISMDLKKEHVDYVYQPLIPGAKNDDGLAHNAQARHDFSYDTHRKTDSTYGQSTNYDQSHAKTGSPLTDSSLPGGHGKNSGMHGSGTNPLTDKIDSIGRSGLHHTSSTGLMGQNPLAGGTGHA